MFVKILEVFQSASALLRAVFFAPTTTHKPEPRRALPDHMTALIRRCSDLEAKMEEAEADDWLLMAMVHHRTSDPDEALRLMSQATNLGSREYEAADRVRSYLALWAAKTNLPANDRWSTRH